MLCSTSICIFKSIVYILIRLTLCPGSDQDRLILCSSQEGAWLGQGYSVPPHLIAGGGKRLSSSEKGLPSNQEILAERVVR